MAQDKDEKHHVDCVPGEMLNQGPVDLVGHVGQHAQQQLEAVQQDGVPCLPHLSAARAVGFCFAGCHEDPYIRVEKNEPDDDHVNKVEVVPLLDLQWVTEHVVPLAEDLGEEKLQWLGGQAKEHVRQDGGRAQGPHQDDDNVCVLERA